MVAGEPSEPARLPRGSAHGLVRPPASKSLAIRALCCAGLCGGTTRIVGLAHATDADTELGGTERVGAAEDVAAALDVLRRVRARVRTLAPAALEIEGRPPGPHRGWRPDGAIEVGESGTLARLATAALALCGDPSRWIEVRARGTLLARESAALFDALELAGVGLRFLAPEAARGRWPVALKSIGPPSELRLERPRSSQEASALLLALAAYPGESCLVVRGAIPSRPYLEMTLDVLARFGARVEHERADDEERFLVHGPLRAPDTPFVVEPDASAAAVALAAACLSGGEVEVPDLGRGSLQGDLRAVEHLRAFGCEAVVLERSIRARGRPRRGAMLDLSGEPDLAPVMAAVAAGAARSGFASRLEGLGTLEGKESARLSVLEDALRRVGLAVERGAESLSIAPGSGTPRAELVLDPRGDHRMAFAFALLGLVHDEVRVADPTCVRKSWPGFWRDMQRAFA